MIKSGISRLICFILLIALAASMAAMMTACASARSSTTSAPQVAQTTPAASAAAAAAAIPITPKSGGTLRVIYPYMGTSLGWPAESLGGFSMYQQLCLEPLLQEQMDGSITYRLATGYKVADDLKSITFTLRKGVKFHDGTDFNAEAVKFNLEALMEKKKGDTSFFSSVEVIDESTVKVNLNNWFNWIISDFSYAGAMYMVSPTAYKENGMDWMKDHMVGTGPFKVKSWQQDVSLIVEKNPDYWQPGRPYLDQIEILCITDPVTAQATILAGDADILQTEADQKVNDLTAKGLKAMTRMVGVANMFPDSKNAASPLADQKVRMAVEYALDKETMSKMLCGGLVSPAYQMAPPNVRAYNPDIAGYKYDPEKAKALLSEAGYPNGLEFTVYPCPVPMFNDMAVAIQADLAKVGITANVEMITDAKFGQLVTQPSENTMILAAVSSCVPNWVQALSLFFNPQGILFPSMLRSEAYTAVYMEAAGSGEYDNTKAQALLKKIYEEEMVIPLFNAQEAWVYQSYVKDAWTVWPAGLQMWNVTEVWMDK